MRNFTTVIGIVIGTALCLAAAPPVAKITSGDNFILRGQMVQVDGVPSWGALPGDEIVAGKDSLMVVFKDGSKAIIAAESRARIEKTADGLAFRLLSGWMTVTRAERSSVKFFSAQTEFAPPVAANASVAVGRTVSMSARVPVPRPPGAPGAVSNR